MSEETITYFKIEVVQKDDSSNILTWGKYDTPEQAREGLDKAFNN